MHSRAKLSTRAPCRRAWQHAAWPRRRFSKERRACHRARPVARPLATRSASSTRVGEGIVHAAAKAAQTKSLGVPTRALQKSAPAAVVVAPRKPALVLAGVVLGMGGRDPAPYVSFSAKRSGERWKTDLTHDPASQAASHLELDSYSESNPAGQPFLGWLTSQSTNQPRREPVAVSANHSGGRGQPDPAQFPCSSQREGEGHKNAESGLQLQGHCASFRVQWHPIARLRQASAARAQAGGICFF